MSYERSNESNISPPSYFSFRFLVPLLMYLFLFTTMFQTVRRASTELMPQLQKFDHFAATTAQSQADSADRVLVPDYAVLSPVLGSSGLPFVEDSALIDQTDHLYRAFRPAMISLSLLYLFQIVVSRVIVVVIGIISGIFCGRKEKGKSNHVTKFRRIATVVIGVCVQIYIHGSGVVFQNAYLVIQYFLLVRTVEALVMGGKTTKKQKERVYLFRGICLSLTWILGLWVIIYRTMSSKYHLKFVWFHEKLAWIDELQGEGYPWTSPFMLSMMRCVSFAWDYCEAKVRDVERVSMVKEGSGNGVAVHSPTLRERERKSLAIDEYSWLNFLTYSTYSCLYISGPIVTFNSFVSYFVAPVPSSQNLRKCVCLGLRLLISFSLMEFFTHQLYPFALCLHFRDFGFDPLNRSTSILAGSLIYFYCVLIYLRLNTIWKFARFWALVDGIDVRENMPRCMHANYTLSEFWSKGWHISVHDWLIRHLYVPLGGRKRKIFAVLIVFLFVGIWHDFFSVFLWSWGIGTGLWLAVGGLFSLSHKRIHSISPFVGHWTMIAGCGLDQLFGIYFNAFGFLRSDFKIDGSTAVLYSALDWRNILWGWVLFFCIVALVDVFRKNGVSLDDLEKKEKLRKG